jgi:hypothetical protein
VPLIGLSRRPGAALTQLPSKAEMEQMVDNGSEINLNDLVSDFCSWFLKKCKLETFWGHAGVSMRFTKPDAATTPPPLHFSPPIREKPKLFQMMDVDGMWATTFALNDGVTFKRKQPSGAGLEDTPPFPGFNSYFHFCNPVTSSASRRRLRSGFNSSTCLFAKPRGYGSVDGI